MNERSRQRLNAGLMILLIILMLWWVLSLITGCAPRPSMPETPPIPSTTSGLTDATAGLLDAVTPSDPTTAAATQSLWPFTWVGALCLLAGVVWMILFRQPLVLILGAVLAAVPFIVLYTSRAFLIPVAIGVASIGLVTLGAAAGRWLGWWDWDRKTDQRAQFLTNMISQGKVPPEQQELTGEVARALSWVGKREFRPDAEDLPHHSSDPVNVAIISSETLKE